MLINDILSVLESFAPIALQEEYDNAGLIIGDKSQQCTGVLTTLDVTEAVLEDAKRNHCNLVVAHHPIIFKGLKKLSGNSYVERTVLSAIKNDIAIYASHTNLDNSKNGVSWKMGKKLGLENIKVLSQRDGQLKKLVTFCPEEAADKVRNALFEIAGTIGNYSECSFNIPGTGTFKAETGANPYVGKRGKRHYEKEIRIEVIFPAHSEQTLIAILKSAHPYEEVAFDIYPLSNASPEEGSGIIGQLPREMTASSFLSHVAKTFKTKVIRHTAIGKRSIKTVALCGGSGFFLLKNALAAKADAYLTGDIKYHEFFDADGKLLLADLGHYESERFTIDLLTDILKQKFPNFAVLKTRVNTNPVNYFV